MPEAPRSIHADSRELGLKIHLKPSATVSYWALLQEFNLSYHNKESIFWI